MGSDENDEKALKKLSVRELRQKAVKSLGSKVAAGLKLKEELVGALVKRTAKEVRPTRVATRKSPPKTTVEKIGKSKSPSPPPPRPSKAAAVAEAYELPISRDFFVDPRRPALPASYGDDRLLCFRREPLAVVVSWDLSAATFEDGHDLAVELISAQGRLMASAHVDAPTGLATFDGLPEGKPLTVQVVRKGRVMTRGRPFMLGAPSGDDDGAWQMTVQFDHPLPGSPERHAWSAAAQAEAVTRARAQAQARTGRPSSSRLSS